MRALATIVGCVCVAGMASADVPLLDRGRQAGVLWGAGDPVSGAPSQLAFNEALGAGASVYIVEFGWRDLEPVPGVIDTTTLDNTLAILQSFGLALYLNLSIVDTNTITVPSDLADPSDPLSLAPGLAWDSPAMIARLNDVIDAVTPLMSARGGFCIAFGDEVDAYLGSRPAPELAAYASLVSSARAHVQSIDPSMAVSVSVTRGATSSPGLTSQLWAVCDAAAYTYFAIDGSFDALPPASAAGDLDAMLADAGSLPVLLQAAGYPSSATNASTEALQAEFVRELDAALRERPRVRAVSWYLLNDWSDTVLDAFEAFFGITDPKFRSYLGSLGLLTIGGGEKQGYDDLLTLLSWCPADLDDTGSADFFDVAEALNRVDASGESGDFDASGSVSDADVLEFLLLLQDGCQ